MKYTNYLVFDLIVCKELKKIGFFTGTAIFMAFLTFKADFPPEAPFAVPLLCAASAYLFGKALADCIGILCYQMSVCSEYWKKYHPSWNKTEESEAE